MESKVDECSGLEVLSRCAKRELGERPLVAECEEVYMREVCGTEMYLPKGSNKGGVGLTLEMILGIPASGECWDCLDGEVKAFPQVVGKNGGRLVEEGEDCPKETVAVTMVRPESDLEKEWEDSRVCKKLSKVLFVGYKREGDLVRWGEKRVFMKGDEMWEELKSDYREIKEYYKENKKTSGKVGNLLQIRTKGPGGEKKSWAFYLKKSFMIRLFKR